MQSSPESDSGRNAEVCLSRQSSRCRTRWAIALSWRYCAYTTCRATCALCTHTRKMAAPHFSCARESARIHAGPASRTYTPTVPHPTHRNGLASFPPRALRPLVCGTGFSFVRRFVGYTNISTLPGTIGNLESLQELCAPLTTPTWHFQELSCGTPGKWPAHESSHCRRPSGTASSCANCACTPRPQPIRASKIIS